MSDWAVSTTGVGGSFTDLATLGFVVATGLGAGMPPLDLITTPYAVRDGASFERTRAQPRVLTLRGRIVGTETPAGLRAARLSLIAAFRRDNDDPQEPVTLRYQPTGATALYLDCFYEGGLELGEHHGFYEDAAVRFLATTPAWYKSATSTDSITVGYTSTATNLAYREAGTWNVISTGSLPATVNALVRESDTAVLAAGGAVLYRHSGSTLTSLGTVTGGSAIIQAVLAAPNGDIYIGGNFTTVNGVAAANVARLSSGTWSALGSGVDSTVQALAWGSDGKLYAAGAFANAGGGAAARIASYDGSAWAALGSGLNGTGYALAASPGGVVYVGGGFTTAGGVTVNRIAQYTISTGAWAALGGGATGGSDFVFALALGLDGSLYAGGVFASIGGVTVNHVARWTGVEWQALSSGVAHASTTPGVTALTFDSAGLLYAVGLFTSAGGVPSVNTALWGGTSWYASDVRGTTVALGGRFAPVGTRLYLALPATVSYPAAPTTITNDGSAAVSPSIALVASAAVVLTRVVNWRTGVAVYLNLDVLAGETITIDAAARSITSSYRGNLQRAVLAGSALGRLALLPGDNAISVYTTATSGVSITYRDYHWSSDG